MEIENGNDRIGQKKATERPRDDWFSEEEIDGLFKEVKRTPINAFFAAFIFPIIFFAALIMGFSLVIWVSAFILNLIFCLFHQKPIFETFYLFIEKEFLAAYLLGLGFCIFWYLISFLMSKRPKSLTYTTYQPDIFVPFCFFVLGTIGGLSFW